MINEVFEGIQGEGKTQGQFRTFIRFNACNLKCNFCFGIHPNAKVPRLTTASKNPVRLDKVEKGTSLLTYNDKFELVETKVVGTTDRFVFTYLKIRINNLPYFVTLEHPFFTTRGLVEAKDLKIGDFILHSSSSEKMSYFAKTYNCMYDKEVAAKSATNTDYIENGKKISEIIARKKQEGTYASSWAKMSQEKRDEVRKNQSLSKQREKNPHWNGTSDRYKNFLELTSKCSKREIVVCELCKETKKLEVHHIDENRENDDRNNLICICHPCHSKIHKRGYNFWKNPRLDNKSIKKVYMLNGFQVESIELIDNSTHPYFGRPYGPKPLHVFNISCEPYNSYFLDYMWVHNCDTSYTWGKGDSHFTLPSKIYNSVVLSGGEPCLSSTWKFIEDTIFSRKDISWYEVETNGTQIPTSNLDKVDLWNISPKNSTSMEIEKIECDPILLSIKDSLKDYIVKFVVRDESDLDFVRGIIEKYNLSNRNIWLMPLTLENKNNSLDVGFENKKIENLVYDLACKNKWNYSARLHVMIKGNKRGA